MCSVTTEQQFPMEQKLPPCTPPEESDDAFFVLGRQFILNGDVQGTGTMIVGGQVIGNIRTPKVIVNQGSTILGDVRCQQLDVTGMVDGNIDVEDIVVRRGARVDGVVSYRSFAMEQGGVVDARMIRKADKRDLPSRAAEKSSEHVKDIAPNTLNLDDLPSHLFFSFSPELQAMLNDGASFTLPDGQPLPDWMTLDKEKGGIQMRSENLLSSEFFADRKFKLTLRVNDTNYEVQVELDIQ